MASNSTNVALNDLKILMVDDHEVFCKGLKMVLHEHSFITKCDRAENGLDALRYLKKESYDIVFIDIQMPKMNGLELATRMKQDHKDSKMIIMTASEDASYVYKFMELGISAYLFKYYIGDEVVKAFDAVRQGHTYINPEIKRIYSNYLLSQKVEDEVYSLKTELSRTELIVAKLICEQLTSEEIAFKLGKKKSTIDTYRNRLFKKLGVTNVVGMVCQLMKKKIFNV